MSTSTKIYSVRYPLLSQKDNEILEAFHSFFKMSIDKNTEAGGIMFFDNIAEKKEKYVINCKTDIDIEFTTFMKKELNTLKTEEASSLLRNSERWAIAYRRWEDFSKEDEEDFWTMFYC